MIDLGYYTVLFQVNYERQLKTIIHCERAKRRRCVGRHTAFDYAIGYQNL